MGGQSFSPAVSEIRKKLQSDNEWTTVYFAIAMLGIMAIFIISHWVNLFSNGLSSRGNNRLIDGTLHLTRSVRGTLIRKVPLYPNLGHAVTFFLYLIINITLCFYDLDWTSLFSFAKRLGWMASYNIALVTFLAVRNTPLAFLTAYSYERLNCLHQMAGYCTIIFALMHGVVFTVALSYEDSLTDLLEDANIMGIVAGFAMLTILATVLVLLKRTYELFYVAHVSLFILTIITVGMHRPEMALKALIIFIFAGSIWISDRIIRFARLTWHAFGTHASVTPLSKGGMRIIVRRSLSHTVPGSHVFLWIPQIRAIETHPFTVVSTNPLKLVVAAHDGFTKDLLRYASKHPNTTLRASFDGPYGKLPNFVDFDQIILIAGGSGASFTFGVAVDLVGKLRNAARRPIVKFIWVVREHESLTWYIKELKILQSSPMVQLTIHVTHFIGASSTITSFATNPEALELSAADQTVIHDDIPAIHNLGNEEKPTYSDIEKTGDTSPPRSFSLYRELDIHPGRPDMASLIPNMIETMDSHERIIVAMCGPKGLMLDSRDVVARLIRVGNRSISLHSEQFGW